MEKFLKSCTLCPRACRTDRTSKKGFCTSSDKIKLSLVSTHMFEEPCISGKSGSGTIFFSGCNLKCVFCQNFQISQEDLGMEVSAHKLAEIFLKKEKEGVHNINLVSPSHFVPQIKESLIEAKSLGLSIPIVYNTNSYELPETLKCLDGLVDIYLADLKYFDSELSLKYSSCPDYFSFASKAIEEMHRQVGNLTLDENGIAKKGLLIRHLVLPSCRKDSEKILSYICETFGKSAYVSIMNQYTPMYRAYEFKEISRKLTTFEYQKVLDFFLDLGMENGFMQGKNTATSDYTPKFDLSGI